MGWFDDGVSKLANKIDAQRQEFHQMSANFNILERTFEKYVDKTDDKIDKIRSVNDGINRRLIKVEGVIDATLKLSMKEAIEGVVKAHIKEKGSLKGINEEGILKSLDQNANQNKSM